MITTIIIIMNKNDNNNNNNNNNNRLLNKKQFIKLFLKTREPTSNINTWTKQIKELQLQKT